jgi:hypothetical protein
MTSRFRAPWRPVGVPNGFAVDDATGRQLGVSYPSQRRAANHERAAPTHPRHCLARI